MSEFEYEEIPESFRSYLETETFDIHLKNSYDPDALVLTEGEVAVMKLYGSFVTLKCTASNKSRNRIKISYSNNRYRVVVNGSEVNDELSGTMLVTDTKNNRSTTLSIKAESVWGSDF